MTEKIKKKLDILFLISLPLITVTVSLIVKANFLVFTLLYFGLPILYLSYRTPNAIIHASIFSLVLSLFGGLMVDHLAILDAAWHVPTIFPYRIFGTVPIEDIIWAFLHVYLIIIFYEHFFDKGKHPAVDKHMRYFMYIIITLFLLFLLTLYYKSQLLALPYFYLFLLVFVVFIPTFLFLYTFPSLIAKFAKTIPYFFFFALIHELTSLELGHWSFPGIHYIGWIEIFKYRFPYEEFFAWMVMFASAVLAYYEFFDEDRRKIA